MVPRMAADSSRLPFDGEHDFDAPFLGTSARSQPSASAIFVSVVPDGRPRPRSKREIIGCLPAIRRAKPLCVRPHSSLRWRINAPISVISPSSACDARWIQIHGASLSERPGSCPSGRAARGVSALRAAIPCAIILRVPEKLAVTAQPERRGTFAQSPHSGQPGALDALTPLAPWHLSPLSCRRATPSNRRSAHP